MHRNPSTLPPRPHFRTSETSVRTFARVLSAGLALAVSASAQVPGDVNLNPTPPPDVTYPLFSDVAPSLGNSGTQLDSPDVGRGVAWADVVGPDPSDPALVGPPDGVLDIIVANSNSPALPLGAPPGTEITPAIGSTPGPCRVYRGETDGTFTDVTFQMGTTGIGFDIAYPGGSPFAVLPGDFDADGNTDLFYPCGGFNTSSVNGLLKNDGDGTFTYVSTAGGGVPENQVSFGATWFDYDRDGDLDLYVTNAVDILSNFYNGPPSPDPTDRLYQNDGTGNFTEVSAQARTGLKSNGFGVVAADLDNDGWSDLLVACMRQYNKVFYNLQNGTFSFMAPPNNPFVSMDIDTDMVELPSGAWELAFVPPNGTQIVPMAGIVTLPVEVGDLNGDGWLDVLFGQWSSQLPDADPQSGAGALYGGAERQYLYLNAGDTDGDGVGEGIYREVGLGAGFDHIAGTMGLLVADFNLDGYLDVYAGNGGPDVASQLEEDFLYVNNGPTWPEDFLSNPAIPLPQALYEIGALAGTYGNVFMSHGLTVIPTDHGPDVYVSNGGPALLNQGQTNVYYANQGTADGSSYRGIEVTLEETLSAPGAIGARVTVLRGHPETREVLQTLQERRGSYGFGSGNLGPLVFGLGRDHPVLARVRWPSGIVQGLALHDRPATAPLTLNEPLLSLEAQLDGTGTQVQLDLENRDGQAFSGTLVAQALRLSGATGPDPFLAGAWFARRRGWTPGPERVLTSVTVPAGGTHTVLTPLGGEPRPYFLLVSLRDGSGTVENQAGLWIPPTGVGLRPAAGRAARLAALAGLSVEHPWNGSQRPSPQTPGAALPFLTVQHDFAVRAARVTRIGSGPLSDGVLRLRGGTCVHRHGDRVRLEPGPGVHAKIQRAPDGSGALRIVLGLPEACCDRTAAQPIHWIELRGLQGPIRADGRAFDLELRPIGPAPEVRRLR